MRLACTLLAVYHLALGLFMAVAPGPFYDTLGGFPPENHHYIRDVATFYLAFGVACAVAVRRPAWRVPVLTLILVEYALHVLNHLRDVGNATSTATGVLAAASLAALTLAFALLLRRARR